MTEYSRDDAVTTAAAHSRALDDLDAALAGRLVRPGDDGYADARRVWNGSIDRFPAAVALATNVDDVRAVLETARTTGLGVAVRAGGHSGPGFSTTDGGIVLDVSAMDAITVDPTERVATVGAGATLGDLDRVTQAYGLATPSGVVSDTGVAGLTLGGGTGWLTRAYGLASDRLRAVDLVSVDGERVRASADEHPDLFRALRGGGGNFGVAVAFEFDLVSLEHDVTYVEAWYPLDRAAELLATYVDLQAAANRYTTVSPYVTGRPDDSDELGVCLLGVHVGPPEDGDAALRPFVDAGEPISTTAERLPYVELQRLLDDDSTEGDRYYWKTIAVEDCTPAVLETFLDRARGMPGSRDTALIWPLGGAVGEVDPSETAVPTRSARFVCNFEATWSDPGEDAIHKDWVRESVAAIRSLGGDGVLPNFAGDERDGDVAREIYGPNYEWLRDVKTAWDPGNVLGPSGRIDPR